MSFSAVTTQELFEFGQSPGKICDLLKGRASRSGVYKVRSQACERDRLGLPMVRSTQSRKVRTSKLTKNTREKIRKNSRRSVRKLASASGVRAMDYTMQTA